MSNGTLNHPDSADMLRDTCTHEPDTRTSPNFWIYETCSGTRSVSDCDMVVANHDRQGAETGDTSFPIWMLDCPF